MRGRETERKREKKVLTLTLYNAVFCHFNHYFCAFVNVIRVIWIVNTGLDAHWNEIFISKCTFSSHIRIKFDKVYIDVCMCGTLLLQLKRWFPKRQFNVYDFFQDYVCITIIILKCAKIGSKIRRLQKTPFYQCIIVNQQILFLNLKKKTFTSMALHHISFFSIWERWLSDLLFVFRND